jgi:alpha-tubulin suppressor-like RCC1 family protein
MVLTVGLLAVFFMTSISWGATPRVAAGGDHTVALRADGSLWGWGNNSFGQIGDGSQLSRNIPARSGADADWARVAAGFYHTVAIKQDGTLWAWGDNTKGQLGDGLSTASRSTPAKIGTGSNWLAVAAGDFHTLALKTDGSLWAWGDNNSGQVGSGAVLPGIQPVPLQIGTATDWAAIAAGGAHSVALKTDHTLWGWGFNAAGQLGNGTALNAVAPVQIKLPAPFTNTDWNFVAAGQSHTAALKTDNSLWSWGSNASGRLGSVSPLDSDVPARESGSATNWLAVTAGDSHTMGRQADGTLWVWGGNNSGQLGNGTNIDAPAPLKPGTDTDWVDAAAGSAHSVAMKANGTVWSWGDNSSGQLGDGTSSPKNAPVQVPFNTLFPPVTITAGAAANGTITPSGAGQVSHGTNRTYTITPNSGYMVAALSVDGSVLPGATAYTFSNITTDHYINAYFAPSDLTVTAGASPNGSISPTGVTAVTPGTDQTFTITPNAGFMVVALSVDGTVLPGATTYTFSGVNASHYINAYFAPSDLTITAAAGADGSISPAGVTAVTPGSNQTYTITPNAGFMVAALSVDGSVLPGAPTYTFNNVTSSHYINAYFGAIPATVTITSGAAPNGSISPAGANVVTGGSNQTYTITPDPGFSVAALVVDGTVLPGATSYTFTNVTTDHYINAYFQ